MSRAMLWLRRDLRLADHPALLRAADSAASVVPVCVADPALLRGGGRRARRWYAAVARLHAATGGALVLRTGAGAEIIPRLAAEVGATQVHVTGETTPYGRRRDRAVAAALVADGRELVATGTPYAVAPGRLRNGVGRPYQIFTPFSRAWQARGWPPPAPPPSRLRWLSGVDSEPLPWLPAEADGAGERVAEARWLAFLDEGLAGYDTTRDLPAVEGTSRLSVSLKYGEIHPRTLLADLAAHPAGQTPGARRFVTELCWREFYADVLWHHPDSAWRDLRPTLAGVRHDDPDGCPDTARAVRAWQDGRTGYPFVDAGMRQLEATGWMHNRLRMVTASFLVKDLHVWWPVGARYFLDQLLDGDLAANNHGWQWVAGTGTDAAPYVRILNPVTQGLRFDPDGDYVRRWVPELAHLPGAAIHQPWLHPAGYAGGYPRRIVDHAAERREALARRDQGRTVSSGLPAGGSGMIEE